MCIYNKERQSNNSNYSSQILHSGSLPKQALMYGNSQAPVLGCTICSWHVAACVASDNFSRALVSSQPQKEKQTWNPGLTVSSWLCLVLLAEAPWTSRACSQLRKDAAQEYRKAMLPCSQCPRIPPAMHPSTPKTRTKTRLHLGLAGAWPHFYVGVVLGLTTCRTAKTAPLARKSQPKGPMQPDMAHPGWRTASRCRHRRGYASTAQPFLA